MQFIVTLFIVPCPLFLVSVLIVLIYLSLHTFQQNIASWCYFFDRDESCSSWSCCEYINMIASFVVWYEISYYDPQNFDQIYYVWTIRSRVNAIKGQCDQRTTWSRNNENEWYQGNAIEESLIHIIVFIVHILCFSQQSYDSLCNKSWSLILCNKSWSLILYNKSWSIILCSKIWQLCEVSTAWSGWRFILINKIAS